MNKHIEHNSTTKLSSTLLLLIMLAVSFGCGNHVYGSTAFRQEADGIQAEQFINYQTKNEITAKICRAKSIKPFPSQIFSFSISRHDVLGLLERPFIIDASLPGAGQIIVSFLSKSQTSHSTSEKPHLFSC